MCDNETLSLHNCTGGGEEEEGDGADDMTERKVIVGFQIAFVIMGVIGNSLMLALMLRKRFREKSFAVYFAFAAVFDTMNIILHCVLDASEVFANVWQLAEISKNNGCKGFHFFEGFIAMMSPWLMVILTVDRFLAVCFSTSSLTTKLSKWKPALVVAIVTTVAMVIVNIPETVLAETQYIEEEDFFDCGLPEEHSENVFYAFYIISRLIPILLLTVLNGIIAITLITGRHSAQHMSDQMKSNRHFNVIVVYVLLITLATWVPLTVVELIEIAYDQNDLWTVDFRETMDHAWHATLVVYLITFVQNFYIFILTSAQYRYELAKMFHLQRFVNDPYQTVDEDQNMKEIQGERTRI